MGCEYCFLFTVLENVDSCQKNSSELMAYVALSTNIFEEIVCKALG